MAAFAGSCETEAVVYASIPVEAAPQGQVDEVVETQRPWITIVWNDPINLMSYVTYVFMTYFHFSREKAEKLMNDVHHEGRAVVSSGTRDALLRPVGHASTGRLTSSDDDVRIPTNRDRPRCLAR